VHGRHEAVVERLHAGEELLVAVVRSQVVGGAVARGRLGQAVVQQALDVARVEEGLVEGVELRCACGVASAAADAESGGAVDVAGVEADRGAVSGDLVRRDASEGSARLARVVVGSVAARSSDQLASRVARTTTLSVSPRACGDGGVGLAEVPLTKAKTAKATKAATTVAPSKM